MAFTGNAESGARLHPWPVRLMHWTNAAALLVMVASGWRIYDNDPIFPWLMFPVPITLGGNPEITYKLHGDAGFGNALLWHFTFMWLLVVNGLAYLAYGFGTGRFRRMLLPIRFGELVATVRQALSFKLEHDDLTMYNAVQKSMYVGVLLALAVTVLAGVAIWKPVQFSSLAALLGGFQGARIVHFFGMTAIVLFLVVHVGLALAVPKTVAAMVTGGPRVGPRAAASGEPRAYPRPGE